MSLAMSGNQRGCRSSRALGAMIRLRGERIVTPSGTVPGEVVVADGRIVEVHPAPRGDPGWLVPGYVDLHVHGGGGAQCNTADPDEIAAVARFHATHGTTALLATTVAAPIDELEAALRAIAATGVLGAHLEGPFISRRRPGAMDPETFVDPDPRVLERLLAFGGVRLMTLAPELPGALELIGLLVQAGVVASLGHSDATYVEAGAAVGAGARAATHLFNAMRPLHHREPGVAGAALDLPELSCELICDGVHADPAALRLAYRAKGLAGIRLATDATEAAGMPDGEYRLGRAAVMVRAGIARTAGGAALAGSTLTMDAAVRNAVRFLGLTVEEAVALASTNPARLLGLGDRKGAIAPGMDADLVVLDDALNVRATMIGGAWVT
jgi:N-acetylglucosamine-6-phosphate deacetylase